jgi:hypothetical protein
MADELKPGTDTPPAVEQMPAMGHTVNELARADIRMRYPGATRREIELRLRSRSLDRETMLRVFGWDPELHGK